MNRILNKIKFSLVLPTLLVTLMTLLNTTMLADDTKWIAVGMAHNWYSSMGCEIEVGRRHLVPDQQDGLIWPAQFQYQDCQAAKALWIGATNFFDVRLNKTLDYKVAHVGPRVWDEEAEFMPQVFKMIGRFDHPLVYVDGVPASDMAFDKDIVEEIDETLATDRLLYNVVNVSIGITMTRKIYAFSQQYHNNYFIYDYVFKNTGVVDNKGTVYPQTLKGLVFFFQYRYAPGREGGPYGSLYFLPQNTAWGRNCMNEVIGENPASGDPFRAGYSWQGKHSGWAGKGDIIGAPMYPIDGHLVAPQFVGFVTIHADKSAQDKTDDPYQPFTTWYFDSNDVLASNNSQFNENQMASEYEVMVKGHPTLSHAEAVGAGNADEFGNTAGGYSQSQGFGPYTLEPGDSIHIVIAEGASGLNRQLCYDIGSKWLAETGPYDLPGGGSTNDVNEYKNAWVFTGVDSIMQTFQRAVDAYNNNLQIPQPPPPPKTFEVNSGGDRIILTWADNAESHPGFAGYRIFRAIHTPDTTFNEIFACGAGTDNPQIVNRFDDMTAVRGFDYYYYIVTFDDGQNNNTSLNLSGPLTSSLFWTRTNEPASLKRQPGENLKAIRIVPNPFNIKARDLQYGYSAPDRIMFLDIPPFCTIKIFTERGDLIQTIEHTNGSGDEAWNSITSSRQVVVSGVYIAYFEVTEDYYDQATGEQMFKKGDNTFRKFVIIR